MKKTDASIISLVILMLSFAVAPAFADSIRINPHGSYYGEAIMLESPATFYVNVSVSDAGTYDVHVLLVMTQTSYESLTGNTVVSWDAGSNALSSWTAGEVQIPISSWNGPQSENIKLPPEAVNGYTVATLKSHLVTDEPIFWYFAPILDGALLNGNGIPFTITLPADEPRMAVWLIAKSPGSDVLDNQLPNTQPGFVVPEAATIFMAVASLTALAGYVLIKKKSISNLR